MRILGIETSCDETAAAIIEGNPGDLKVKVLSNIVASSLSFHAKTGGIIPEVAARQQIKFIIPVIEKAMNIQGSTRGVDAQKIDAIAITVGPGLIGSLLIGVKTAKTLAFAWNKPIIPVNHLLGHIYSNFIDNDINFPFIGLIVSGGHTDLLLFKSHKNYKWLGGTKDDAAGEALDKIARILGLPYPGGPEIEKRAKNGNPKAFNFPRPMIGSDDFDFSFSGLKTAVLREVSLLRHSGKSKRSGDASRIPTGCWTSQHDNKLNNQTINDVCASAQQAIIDVLVKKTVRAAKIFNVSTIVLGGGVTANENLRSQFKIKSSKLKANLSFPDKKYATDNAAMIATTAFFQSHSEPWKSITANPELYFD